MLFAGATKDQATTVIANAIEINADHFTRGEISVEAWHEEQLRLWGVAAEVGCLLDVLAIVAPSSRGNERGPAPESRP